MTIETISVNTQLHHESRDPTHHHLPSAPHPGAQSWARWLRRRTAATTRRDLLGLAGFLLCSVMSVNHSWFGASAVNSCVTRPFSPVTVQRSSWTVDRGPGLFAVLAPLLPECAPPSVGRRDPPCSPVDHRFAGVTGFVGQQPMPELGVVAVRVE